MDENKFVESGGMIQKSTDKKCPNCNRKLIFEYSDTSYESWRGYICFYCNKTYTVEGFDSDE